MKPRLLADENTSHRLVAACQQIEGGFPIMHISEWENGAYLSVKDPALLMTLREHEIILVGFELNASIDLSKRSVKILKPKFNSFKSAPTEKKLG